MTDYHMTDVTIDIIMETFERWVVNQHPIATSTWLDGASKINALVGNLDDAVVEAEMTYRRIKAVFIEGGESVAKAEALAKAHDAYRVYLKLKAKRERVEQFMMLAKKRTELAVWDKA